MTRANNAGLIKVAADSTVRRDYKHDRNTDETSELMSETPTPTKPATRSTKPAGPVKRGGLALPPRGQALARLQDLEEEVGSVDLVTEEAADEPLSTVSSNAVNTASSNAVTHQGSTSVSNGDEGSQSPLLPPEAAAVPLQTLTTRKPKTPPASGETSAPKASSASDYQAPARAAREPTTRITVDMPDSLHQKISVLSAQTRRSIKDLVIEALAVTYFGAGTDPR